MLNLKWLYEVTTGTQQTVHLAIVFKFERDNLTEKLILFHHNRFSGQMSYLSHSVDKTLCYLKWEYLCFQMTTWFLFSSGVRWLL